MKNMQTNKLVAALAAVGAVSFAGFANAAAINPDGLGEVLLYPMYTVNGNNATLLSVVNTTTQGKVVKLRFREAKNSEDVRDFNIYLSAQDVWTGGVYRVNSEGALDAAGDRAGVFTQDTSCTGPHKAFWPYNNATPTSPATMWGVPFTNSDYFHHDNATRGSVVDQDFSRTLQGYFEVIEQATVPTSSTMYKYIDHRANADGKPNCNGLHHYLATSNVMAAAVTTSTTPTTPGNSYLDSAGNYQWASHVGTLEAAKPSGGLFGSAALVNVGNGASTAYSATALNGFERQPEPRVWAPGSEHPSLIDSATTSAAIITSEAALMVKTDEVVYSEGVASGAAAVDLRRLIAATLPFYATNVQGEYFYSSDLAAATDWVLTFPNKRSYVTFAGAARIPVGTSIGKQPGDAFADAGKTIPPFAVNVAAGGGATVSAHWNPTGTDASKYQALVGVGAAEYDREERTTKSTTSDCLFSPCDPGSQAPGSAVRFESSVLAFGPKGYTGDSSGALGAKDPHWLLDKLQTPGVGGGWLDLSFKDTRPVVAKFAAGVHLRDGVVLQGSEVTFNGLPVMGFQVTSLKSVGQGGVRDNYRHSSNLNFVKSVVGYTAVPAVTVPAR